VNKEENPLENDGLNLHKDIEYSVDKYNPGGSFRVYVSDKWWHSETSLDTASKENLRIIKLSRTLFPGWDIKKGDYKVDLNDEDILKEFKKPDRDKIKMIGFAFTIIVVVLIVLYVSITLGNSILSDVNTK
jgi:hypothetical protein